MNILYLNNEDIIGRRFNGFDLMLYYNGLGHKVSMVVWDKRSLDKSVIKSWNLPFRRFFKAFGYFANRFASLPNIFYPFHLLFKKEFWKADIIHLHLIGNNYFSLFELPLITIFKPTVITVHEFSFVTSHCNYPASNCVQWKIACRSCPDRIRPFGLTQNTEGLIWDIKKFIYSKCNLKRVIVSSHWFKGHLKESPLLREISLEKISFGINLDLFKPADKIEKSVIRNGLGISQDSVVLFLRALDIEYKNMKLIFDALKNLNIRRPVTILTVQEKGLFNKYTEKFQVIDMGLVTSDFEMAKLYQASDIFLMPSRNETFGMMSVEAMACGLACIVSSGTVLQEIANAPYSAISVGLDDVQGMRKNLEELIDAEDLRKDYGSKARKFAVEKYAFKKHADALMNLYQKVISES